MFSSTPQEQKHLKNSMTSEILAESGAHPGMTKNAPLFFTLIFVRVIFWRIICDFF